MTPPVRGAVHALTQFPKEPEEMTLRDALEWFKKCIRALDGESLNPLEVKTLNQRWAFLCDAIGKREGVPTGSISYYLGELAHAEVQLAETAELEAQAAHMYQ